MVGKKKEEDSTPDYIVKHKKLYDHAGDLADAVGHAHSEAYMTALNKHIVKDGKPNFKLLDDAKVQREFVKTMSDFYVTRAKEHFKVSTDLDDLDRDILMQAYTGVTQDALRESVSKYGKNLKHEVWAGLQQQIKQRVQERLYGAAGSHLTDEHKETIVRHIGLEDKVNTAMLTLEEARNLLEAFHEHGAVTDTVLRQHVSTYKLKKEKKEEKKAA